MGRAVNIEQAREQLATFVARHARVALLFSSGKDSAACLELLRPHIERVVVLWSNPGDPYPETLDYMADVRRSVPHFVEAQGIQPEWVRDHGRPVDMVPFESTPMGRLTAGNKPAPKLVSLDACCNRNMWGPLWHELKASGATGCVRGDKQADIWRPRLANGDCVDGIEYHFPLSDWHDPEVFWFLGDKTPNTYKRGHVASFDCMSCTAYLSHQRGRIAELRHQHPMKFAEVAPVLMYLRDKARHLHSLIDDEL